jgi:GTP pyrophosphokinase
VQGINITEATCRASDNGRATNTFTFLCADLAQLKDVVRNLQKIDGVIDVDRG